MVARGDLRRASVKRSAEPDRYSLRSRSSTDSVERLSTAKSLRTSEKTRESKQSTQSTPGRISTKTMRTSLSPRLSAPPLRTSTPRGLVPPGPRRTSRKKQDLRIPKAAIRRIAHKAEVHRLGRGVHEEIVRLMETFLQEIVADLAILCDYRRRRTVLIDDVHEVLRRYGRRVYGFDAFELDN
ncbi:hypothetical protein ANCCAN_13583 [Ancylostoma caninum]|uniref:Histone H4 n=1 Tax=Ancylostoma caninum TaxID=29170 RepID=A0A368GBS3_ANCCA|nr:hypothetical protein ANCCAN_13583 [Ancylostoma caninum]